LNKCLPLSLTLLIGEKWNNEIGFIKVKAWLKFVLIDLAYLLMEK
jgi:hypothetical protein